MRMTPLLKMYRWELRLGYAAWGWSERHPRIFGTIGWVCYIIFCCQMFVGCMDWLCQE